MRIGIDIRALEGGAEHRGIGRYGSHLIEAISRIDHDNEYVFLLTGPDTLPPKLNLDKDFRHSFVQGPGAGLRSVRYIRIFRLLPRPLPVDDFGLDVVFQLSPWHRLKARRTPVVATLFDLIPFKFGHIYQKVPFGGLHPKHSIGYVRARLQWRAVEHDLKAYHKAARIVSISESSRADLLEWFPNLNPHKVVAVPLAADMVMKPPKTRPASLKKLGLGRFLFYVGGADVRKGMVKFTQSLEELWARYPDLQLVVAGKEFDDPDVAEAVRLKKTARKMERDHQVFFLGYISDAELAWLYANAEAFVFPSIYEGFGLPILEAMQAGCPVVAYDNSSIPEVAGDAALLVPDDESLVPALERLLADPRLRQGLIDKGRAQAAKFTWAKTARETLRVIKEAAR